MLLYYWQVLKYLLYLIINYYLITIFVVLLVGAEAADKAQSDTRHLPNKRAIALREG
jgi:hypothetical protein